MKEVRGQFGGQPHLRSRLVDTKILETHISMATETTPYHAGSVCSPWIYSPLFSFLLCCLQIASLGQPCHLPFSLAKGPRRLKRMKER